MFQLNTVGKKFIVPTILLLILLLGGLGYVVVSQNNAFGERMMSTRGEAMATFMEQVGRGLVSTYNLREIDVMVDNALKDPDIVYAMFYDDKGKPLMEKDHVAAKPKDDGELLRITRDIKDADGRPLGSLDLYYTSRSLNENTRRGFRTVLFGLAVTIVLFGVGLALLSRRILRPIRELTRVTRDVVRNGDLRQSPRATSSDEIGQLAVSFAEMVAKLRDALGNLQSSSLLLDSSVVNLTTSNREQGETLARQSAALQETQTTAQEIKQTSALAAQKAESVLEVMQRADQISQMGEAAVEKTLVGLSEIRDRVQEISGRIGDLSSRAQQIAGITDTVKDLADQSNMLALNAAIEAVRSGEHGKGFSVVAREIRSLADQSIKATSQVREILNDIGAAIRDAVSITQAGVQRVEAGLVQVRSSGDSLRQLSGIVKENSSAARQIASAVNQQNAGIVQIFAAVNDLSKMMDDSLKRLESASAASNTVSDVSRRAAGIVRDYRV